MRKHSLSEYCSCGTCRGFFRRRSKAHRTIDYFAEMREPRPPLPTVDPSQRAFETLLAENLQTEAPFTGSPREPDGLISKIIMIGDAEPPDPPIHEVGPKKAQAPRRRREKFGPVQKHGEDCVCERCGALSAFQVATLDGEIREKLGRRDSTV